MGEMVTWQREKLIDYSVWENLRPKLSPAVLPPDTATLQLPPATETRFGQQQQRCI